MSVEERLAELEIDDCPPEIDEDIKKKMFEKDTMIEIQFYPHTPIGSYVVYHHNLDKALDKALDCLATP